VITARPLPSSRPARPRVQALPLASFVERLRTACDPPSPAAVEDVLARFRPSAGALAPHVRFQDDRYARVRLHRSQAFELLLLAWEPGQATPIHDHDGQAGWFTVLEGRLSVQEFERDGGPADLRDLVADAETEAGRITLRPGRTYVVDAGRTVAEAGAPETIHRVGASGRRAVSLHLYAGPLDSLVIFDEQRGTARRVSP